LVDRIVDRNLPLAEKFDVTSIGLLGHSRGGSAVLCVGAESDAVSSVATLASIARPPAVSAEEERAWREAGVHYILNSRTDQQMPLGLGLLDDFRANPDRIEQCVRRLNKPLLIIHGSDDTTVPATAAQEIDSWAPNSELVVLDGADHTFGVGHPFKGASPDCAQVIDCLIRFFEA
jgi:pimeloyl-ACP methyl ester carboxylesterase